MTEYRSLFSISALVAASLIASAGPAFAEPTASTNVIAEQTLPRIVESALASLEQLPTAPKQRAVAVGEFASRLANTIEEPYRLATLKEQRAALDQILTKLDRWNGGDGKALADDFLTRMARSLHNSGRPADALTLYHLKLDRLNARPIGTNLDDFFATMEEARQLPKLDTSAVEVLIKKAITYVEDKRNGGIQVIESRIHGITTVPGSGNSIETMRNKAQPAVDALHRLGASLLIEGRYTLAGDVLMQEVMLSSTYLRPDAPDAPDTLIMASAETHRLMVEAYDHTSSGGSKIIADSYSRSRIWRWQKLFERHPSDLNMLLEYGWALRARIRRLPETPERATYVQDLDRNVTRLMELHGNAPNVHRLATAYYDDLGSDASDPETELSYHNKALEIAQAARLRFGDDAVEQDDVTAVAMNSADTLKRLAREQSKMMSVDVATTITKQAIYQRDISRFYDTARAASDKAIAKNPDAPTTINLRLKLLALEATQAKENGNLRQAIDAADMRIRLAEDLEKRGYDVSKILPQARKFREAIVPFVNPLSNPAQPNFTKP